MESPADSDSAIFVMTSSGMEMRSSAAAALSGTGVGLDAAGITAFRRGDPSELRRRLYDDIVILPALALVGEALFAGPRFDQQIQAFRESLLRFFHRNAKRLELRLAVAAPYADVDAAIRKDVER